MYFWASSEEHSILDVGLLMGKMMGRSLLLPISCAHNITANDKRSGPAPEQDSVCGWHSSSVQHFRYHRSSYEGITAE